MNTQETPIPRNAATDATEAIEALFAACHPDAAHKVQRYLGEYIDCWVSLLDTERELIQLANAGKEYRQDWEAAYEAGVLDGTRRTLSELEQLS